MPAARKSRRRSAFALYEVLLGVTVFVIGVVAAMYRAATRPPMSYGGAVLETPFGLSVLAIGRVRQSVKEGWATRLREMKGTGPDKKMPEDE